MRIYEDPELTITAGLALYNAQRFLLNAKGPTNYERQALEDAVRLLQGESPRLHEAAQVIADAVDHAFRPGFIETRPEAAVCMDVLQGLKGWLQ